MTTILLVEDDATISAMLSAYIEREGFEVFTARDWVEAMNLFEAKAPNLVILDLNLPLRSGLEILPEMRAASACPILVLSARIWEDDRVAALELGADDFISKPFSARELMARIARHLARSPQTQSNVPSNKEPSGQETLSIGSIEIYLDKYSVTIAWEPVRLTKTEFELLVHIGLHMGEVVTRQTLMKEIIGYERYLSDRTIDTHMKNLRKKFEGHLVIETLRAIGYRAHTT